MAIDRAVLLPGQELMERMDREYNAPNQHPEELEKVRSEEIGGQAENAEKGQDPEQDRGTAEKVHQDKSEEAEVATA